MIVFDNHSHAHLIALSSGAIFNPAADRCISREENGLLLGGTLLSGYTGKGGSISVHIAGFTPTWMTRDLIWVTFDYIFNQLGCAKLFGQVPASNQKALEFDLKMGYKVEHVIEGVFPDGDLYLVAMRREGCRWLKLKPRGIAAGGAHGR